jgi:hypothetical protein
MVMPSRFAEMDKETKNKISHRARSIQSVIAYFEQLDATEAAAAAAAAAAAKPCA